MAIKIFALLQLILSLTSCSSYLDRVVSVERDYCSLSTEERIITRFAMDAETAPSMMTIDCEE